MRFTVPASTPVTQLGRYKVTGDSKTHTVKLLQLAGNAGTVVGQATVNMSGTPSNGYVNAALASAVTLTAGNTYALGSQEVAGATEDQFLETTPVTVAAGTATVLSAAYSMDGVTWVTATTGPVSYGPPNLMIGGGGGGGSSSLPLIHFREMYQYTAAGLMLGKRLWAETSAATGQPVSTDTLQASYTFDNEGRMTGQQYPGAQPVGGGADVPGETFAYGYDAMGRPATMTSGGGATSWISGVTYNHLGMPTAITAGNASVAGRRGLTTRWGS